MGGGGGCHGSGNTFTHGQAMNIQHSRYKYMDDLLELDGCGTPAGKPRGLQVCHLLCL